MATKQIRQQRIAAGLCDFCGKHPAAPDRKSCENCLKKRKTYQQKYHDRDKANGICTSCRQNPISEKSTQHCDDCKIKRAQQLSARYRRWQTDGLCARCGKVPATDGSMCYRCTVKVGKRKEEWKQSCREKGICYKCMAPPQNKGMCEKCWSGIRERRRAIYKQLRYDALLAYGEECDCCGEDSKEFLNIDHINGGGNQHRKEVGHSCQFLRWLKRNGYPNGFRILCFNCNCAMGIYGYCPHQSPRITKTSKEHFACGEPSL
jgi:hypothetical protein